MGLPHWLMVIGTFLVLAGLIGLALNWTKDIESPLPDVASLGDPAEQETDNNGQTTNRTGRRRLALEALEKRFEESRARREAESVFGTSTIQKRKPTPRIKPEDPKKL